MKKILFVVDSLGYGGIEKTAVSWIKYLSSQKNTKISLMLLRDEGVFKDDIPNNIKVETINCNIQKYLMPLRIELIKCIKSCKIRQLFALLRCVIVALFTFKKMSLGEKIRYNAISKLPKLKENYDVAIAYSDHATMYYVCDKVNASKKILWVHADYSRIKRKFDG